MSKKNIIKINKVAKIATADLPIPQRAKQPDMHFVFVRDYNTETKKYSVNICTHLSSWNRTKKRYEYNDKQLNQVRKGNVYPIPTNRSNFPFWTGIKKKVHYVDKGKMYEFDCVKIKGKHDKNYTKFFK